MTRVYNKEGDTLKRKMLRENLSQAEVLLWSMLKGKGLNNYKFRRQYNVGKFVIEFYCPKSKLAIEVDGDSHFVEGAKERDRERQTIIETFGITFLRFTNREIYKNIEGVLDKIMEYIQLQSPSSPPY